MNFKGATIATLLAFGLVHAFAFRADAQDHPASVWPTTVCCD